MSNHDAIRDRIRKLLNMTEENGCTEDEAETAMRMAAGLMARHGIDEDSIRAQMGQAKRTATRKRHSAKLQNHQVILAQAAAVIYGCEVWTYNGGKFGIEFVGREENIEMAQDTMFWLIRQVDFIYKAHLPKGLTQQARKKYRDSFKDHCAARVLQRAHALVEEMKSNEQAATQATGSTALVVANHFAVLREEIEEVRKMVVFSRRRSRGGSLRQGWGASEGYAAGDKVQLRKGGDLQKGSPKLLS
jgi:hypothetical protein